MVATEGSTVFYKKQWRARVNESDASDVVCIATFTLKMIYIFFFSILYGLRSQRIIDKPSQ